MSKKRKFRPDEAGSSTDVDAQDEVSEADEPGSESSAGPSAPKPTAKPVSGRDDTTAKLKSLPEAPKPKKAPSRKSNFVSATGDEVLPQADVVKGKREISIFDQKPRSAAAPETVTAAPGPGNTPKPGSGSGGDTIQMKAVSYDPEKAAVSRANTAPGRAPVTQVPRPRPQQPRRVADLPRKEYAPRNRFGFFSFIFGFFGLIFKIIFVTVLTLALSIGLSYYVISTFVKTPQVVVPNVKGMKVIDAMKVLSDDGKKDLALLQDRAEASGLVAPGEIIEQKPAPGTTVKKGYPIRVVVSSGRARLTVPEVVRETRDNAVNKIKGAGLEVGDVIYVENETVPREQVISQSPEGGKGLENAAKVDLMVSRGPSGNSVSMPDVTGKSVGDAKKELGKSGITDIVVEPPGNATAVVREQDPLVGKFVLQSQKVTLKTGPAETPAVSVR